MKPSARTTGSTPQSGEEDCAAKFKTLFRSRDEGGEELSPPSGFCFLPSGNLLLADDFNHRIQIYDANHDLIQSFGRKGNNPGEFHYPRGIAIDSQENIYVADSWNHRVQKFDRAGNHLLSIGSCGEGKGKLNEPHDVLIAPNADILVVERYNHRIQVFSPQGDSRGWVGGRGTVLEEQLARIYETPKSLFSAPAFEFPTSIARDSRGNYYISDSGNHRILKFDSQWNLLLAFGERGKKPGQFEYPLCVSAGQSDHLYVADLNNDRVQVFTSSGQALYELKQADDSLLLKAPSLTTIAPDGSLVVGLTFDTRVTTYQPPPEPKKEELKIEGDKKFKANLLLELNRLSANTGDAKSESVLLQGLDIVSRHLDKVRLTVITAHEQWEEAAVLHNQQLFAEHRNVLNQTEDPTAFNRNLFQAETLDKTRFRELRHHFYTYRETVEQGSDFFCNLINTSLSGPNIKPCMDFIEIHLARIGDQMIHLLEAKEQNEKTMMESFADTESQEEKWETFLLRSNANARIMDVLRQFNFEIRSLLACVKAAALKFPDHIEIEKTLYRQFIEPQGLEKFLKILLGFQEECFLHSSLEIPLKDLIDLWMIRRGTEADTVPIGLTRADLEPVSFQAENLTLKEIAQPLLTEGMPLRKISGGLACGHLRFSAASIRNEADFIKTLWALWENQQVYETKYLETHQQLETLSRQKQELEIKANRVNPQDKQTPITLENNLAVVKFQVSVLKRMALTMEINEANNLFRLAIGTGFLMGSEEHKRSPETSRLLEALDSFHRDLEETISQALQKRKTLTFETSRLNGILNSGPENKNIEELNQSLQVNDQLTALRTRQETQDSVLSRQFKTRNWLNKILKYGKTFSSENASRDESFSNFACSFSFANSGPGARNLRQPYGVATTPEGDVIVSAYENHQVIRFSSQGIYKNHFGGYGNAPGFFHYPVNVQVDHRGYIYVADEKNTRIQKFSGTGEFLLSFGDHESEDQRLGPVFSLSIDLQDQVWVADPSHHRIQIYSAQGELIRSVSGDNNPPEGISEPTSIHCQETGDYLVGDKSAYLLKRFSRDGNLIDGIKKEGLGFGEIYFIASHPAHGIFATDYWSNRILHLSAQLDVISILNNPGQRAGQFGKVGGLAILDNQLMVADFENFRVQALECPALKRGS